MSYRDELEAAQHRADALEKELNSLKKEALVQLNQDNQLNQNNALSSVSEHYTRIERRLQGELPMSEIEPLVKLVRTHFGEYGQVHTLPNSVTWTITKPEQTNPWVYIRFQPQEHETSLCIEYKHRKCTPLSTELKRIPLYAMPPTAIVGILCLSVGWPWWVVALPSVLLVSLFVLGDGEDKRFVIKEAKKFDSLMDTLMEFSRGTLLTHRNA